MQLEAEPTKPFLQHVHNPLGIVVGIEGHHEIISPRRLRERTHLRRI
jgi:hypothetical protein